MSPHPTMRLASPAVTAAATPGWTRRALRWLPTFVGFPLGGLAAELITGRVDGPVGAIGGGAITGLVLGTVQWVGLRRYGLDPLRWIAGSAVGLAVGLGIGAATVDYRTNLGSLALQGAISGAALGLAQAAALRRRAGRAAAAWPAVLALAWALGWTITTKAGVDVEAQYTVFGSTGAIVVTAITSILPLWLSRRSPSPR